MQGVRQSAAPVVVVVTVVEVLLGQAVLALRNESVRPGTERDVPILAPVVYVKVAVVYVTNVGVIVVVVVHGVRSLVVVIVLVLVWLAV